jgi:hypothetical protein
MAKERNMSNIAVTHRRSDTTKLRAPGWLSHLKAHLSRAHAATEQAHNQRRMYDHHPDAAFHDAGLSRDDAMAIGSHQTALPFFLQSGFGKR